MSTIIVLQEDYAETKKYKGVYETLAFAIALLLFDFSPFGGNITYYLKWISYGQKPVYGYHQPFWDISYYEEIMPIQPLRYFPITRNYFCIPLEAEERGFSNNQLRAQCPLLNTERK